MPANVDTTGFALILGGGGARGIAHIGVIEVLEDLGMRPDLIVGTSMGSVVGSLYASGMSSSELEELALGQDLLNMVVEFDSSPAQLQGGWWGESPHQISLQISHWPPLPDIGLSRGQSFESLIGENTGDALFVAGNNYDNLPIAFRCVSTDLLESSLVVHQDKSLARAVKASSSIPMIFYPVQFDGRELVDGGILDNVPVQVARRLGFDRAVLVDVSNVHLPDKDSPEDLYEMLIRTAELQTLFPNEYTVGPNDVLLKIPLEPYRAMEMEAAPEILAIGRETATRYRSELMALRDACGPSAWEDPPVAMDAGPVTIKTIEVLGLTHMNPDRVLDRLQIHRGDRIDIAATWRKAEWLTREGSFQTIGFEFNPVAVDTADLVIHVQEETKPRLELGASVMTDEGAAIMARLRVDNLLGRGGSNLLSSRYSDRESRAEALFGQTMTGSGWLSLRGHFLWQRELPGLYHYGDEVDLYVFRRTQLSLDFVLRSNRYGCSLYFGGDFGETNSYQESRQGVDSGVKPLQTVHVSLESHARDLPVSRNHQGARLRHIHSLGDGGNEQQWWRTDMGFVLPLADMGSWKSVLAVGAVLSSTDIPVVHQGRAGGPRGWVGLHHQEIIAPQIAWSRVALQRFLGDGLYLEIAGAVGWHGQEELAESKPLWGGGLEVGMDSLVGPLRLGFALAEERSGYLYIQAGYVF
jgi:NTE family protein